MPPAASGRILAWGWRCYQGETIFLDEEKRSDPETQESLILAGDILDSTALALNIIDVVAFSEARQKDREISKKRAQAREKRFQDEAEAQSNVVPMARYADGSTVITNGTKGDHEAPDTPEGRLATVNLVGLGMSEFKANVLVSRYSKSHGQDCVLMVTEKMKGRNLISPEKYFSKAIQNVQEGFASKTDATSSKIPKAVRRQVSPRADGSWEFLGWTYENHPRSNPGIEGRKKVWRTDSGKLSYKPAEENETPPSFDDDPGVKEVE